MFVLVVAFDDGFGGFSGYEEPFARVGQVLVLDGQIFGQNAFTPGQPVGVRAEQLIVLVLVLVVTVAGRKYVVVELHHGYDAGVQQILRAHHLGASVLP